MDPSKKNVPTIVEQDEDEKKISTTSSSSSSSAAATDSKGTENCSICMDSPSKSLGLLACVSFIIFFCEIL